MAMPMKDMPKNEGFMRLTVTDAPEYMQTASF
jgi:hypothetical protein